MPHPSPAPSSHINMTSGGFRSAYTDPRNPLNTNNGYQSSVAEMSMNPDGSMSTQSKLEAMKPYFGVAQRQSQEAPYSYFDAENYDLPDGLKGRCAYVLNILITAILTSETWPVTEMLPYKKNETGLKIAWDEWHFNDSLLDRTPEESVSRMTTSNFNSFSAHLVRRGKAFMLEHGFWLTPMGQKNWAMNIVQIVNATTETACFGSTHAVLTAPQYVDPNDRYRSAGENNMTDIDTQMAAQTDAFARVQKEEGGYDVMVAKMIECFENRNGHKPNYMVLPSGANNAVRSRPEEQYFYLNGVGKTNRDVSKEGGWTTRMSRGYRVGEHQPNLDPHFSVVCIGGFHVFNNVAANLITPEQYRTFMRNIVIFSMSKDDYVTLEFETMFPYLGLYDKWDTDAPERSWIGDAFLGKYQTWGKLLDAAGEKQRVLDKLKHQFKNADELASFIREFRVGNEQDNSKAILKGAPSFEKRVNRSFEHSDQSYYGKDAFKSQPRLANSIKGLEHGQPSLFAEPHSYAPRAAASGDDDDVIVAPPTEVVEVFNKETSVFKNAIEIADSFAPEDEKQNGFYLLCRNNERVCDIGPSGGFLTIDPADGYKAAAREFLLLDMDYAPKNPVTITKSDPSFKLTTLKAKKRCARVEISIAISLLVGMLRYIHEVATVNNTKTDDIDFAPYIVELRNWLHTTLDVSGYGGACHTLATLFTQSHRELAYQTSVPGQAYTDFKLLFDLIVKLSNNQIDTKGEIDAMRKAFGAIPARVRVDRQEGLSGGPRVYHSHDAGKNVEFAADRTTWLHTQLIADTKFVIDIDEDTKDKLYEWGLSIKKIVEDALVKFGGKKAIDMGRDAFNSGFNSRFNKLGARLGQLRLVTQRHEDVFTEQWYSAVLFVIARMPTRSLAEMFLDDVVHSVIVNDFAVNSIAFITPIINGGVYTKPTINTLFDVNEKPATLVSIDRYIAFALNSRKVALLDSITKLTEPRTVTSYTYAPGPTRVKELKTSKRSRKAANKPDAADTSVIVIASENIGLVGNLTAPGGVATLQKYLDFINTLRIADERESFMEACQTVTLPEHTSQHVNKPLIYIAFTLFRRPLPGDALDAFSLIYRNYAAKLTDDMAYKRTSLEVFANEFNIAVRQQKRRNPLLETARLDVMARIASETAGLGALHTRITTTDKWITEIPSTVPVKEKSKNGKQEPFVDEAFLADVLDKIPLSSGRWAKWSLKKDLPMPIGMIGFRLHKRWDMGTGFVMDAYGAAGYTWFGHADFQLGDDVGKKVHVAHFTLYLKSVVMFCKLIVYSRYIFCRAYLGGEGVDPYNPLDRAELADFHHARLRKSTVYAPVLSNFRADHTVMDVTGRFPPAMKANNSANDVTLYESADIMCKVWGFEHAKGATGELGKSAPMYQTIAFQEHTQTWCSTTQAFTTITMDHGHWGARVYPKCGKVRRGEGRWLERCAWEQTKTITIGT